MIYALDTNIISFYLKGKFNMREKIRDALIKGDTLVIPPLVLYEIKRGFRLNPAPSKEKAFDLLYGELETGTQCEKSLILGAKIFADTKARNPKDADTLIAAFCIVNDYTLVTNNTKDFDDIDGIKIVDWTV